MSGRRQRNVQDASRRNCAVVELLEVGDVVLFRINTTILLTH